MGIKESYIIENFTNRKDSWIDNDILMDLGEDFLWSFHENFDILGVYINIKW